MKIEHINPAALYSNAAFSQAVSVDGARKLVFVGGQNGVTGDGTMLDGLEAQSEQAIGNVVEALKAAGALPENVVRLAVYLVQGQDVRAAFGAAQKIWSVNPTAVTVLIVAGLANPQALIEVEATAAL
jgi:2-iminobutanoate/2-iminopropanoate deaminase